MSDEIKWPEPVEADAVTRYIANMAQKIHSELTDEILKIPDPESRWLAMSRILNSIYQHHFGLSIGKINDKIEKVYNDAKTK